MVHVTSTCMPTAGTTWCHIAGVRFAPQYEYLLPFWLCAPTRILEGDNRITGSRTDISKLCGKTFSFPWQVCFYFREMFAFNVIFLVGVFCTIAGVNAENKSKRRHYKVLPYKYVPKGVLQFPPSSHWVVNGNCYEDRATREKSYVMTMVYIDPCNHKPCILVAGQVYNVTTGFIPLKEVSGGHVNVEVYMPNRNPAHEWLPYPGFKTLNLCDQLLGGFSCPLKARQEVYFRSSLLLRKGDTLLSILPKLVDLRWTVRDDSGKVIFCSIIEACNSKECIFDG